MRQIHSLSIGLILGMVLPRVFEPASEVSVRVWVVLLVLVIANLVSWFGFISGLTKRAADLCHVCGTKRIAGENKCRVCGTSR